VPAESAAVPCYGACMVSRSDAGVAGGTRLIFLGLLAGVVLGGFLPSDAHPWAYELFRFLSKAFLRLVKSVVAPIVFATLVSGMVQVQSAGSLGRLGARAFVYFEVVTTVALFLGLGVAHLVAPGVGLPLDHAAVGPVKASAAKGGWEILLHAFPENALRHAAEGDVLPLVVFATLFALALRRTGEKGAPVASFVDGLAHVMFRYTEIVMAFTPLGVFGAMASNVSHMAAGHAGSTGGWGAVAHLLGRYAALVSSLYGALFVFVALVLVPILLALRVPIVRFFSEIRDPVLTAFSTASSEAALPKLLDALVRFGVPKPIAGFVLPAGYSFNLDGSTLYLALASMTIAQASGVQMTFAEELAMMGTFILASKGVAGVPRATLVIIASTCEGFRIPGEAGVAMLLAVDELMDMARSATNVIGNATATVVMARWEGVPAATLGQGAGGASATS
jgi:proton glutamate symport protein